MAIRTGIVALTIFVKHVCHVLDTWRPAINSVIAAAVSAGTITSAQATTLGTWLDGAAAACAIVREVSGY